MASFSLNCLLKSRLFNYSHILRYWGLERQHVNLGKTQFHLCQQAQDKELWLLAHSAPAFIYLPSRAAVLEPGRALEPSGEFKQEEL